MTQMHQWEYIVVVKKANQKCCNMKHLKDAYDSWAFFFSTTIKVKKTKHYGATEASFRVMAMTKKSKSIYFFKDSIPWPCAHPCARKPRPARSPTRFCEICLCMGLRKPRVARVHSCRYEILLNLHHNENLDALWQFDRYLGAKKLLSCDTTLTSEF